MKCPEERVVLPPKYMQHGRSVHKYPPFGEAVGWKWVGGLWGGSWVGHLQPLKPPNNPPSPRDYSAIASLCILGG